jgi:cellulose synthase/poly-beta-1,6-N-acetylglucosamine synthase-like glycosyltransferase
MLTVSMPTYNTPPHLLDRAVGSVLTQTYNDLRLVVVNDGGKPVSLHDDRRLTVFDLPENRGRYFCDAVVAGAVEEGWWSPHDSDDWSEPSRFTRQIVPSKSAVLAPYWRERRNMRRVVPVPNVKAQYRFRQVGHWCAGVYRIERVSSAGGIHPEFRIGFDTLFTLMLTLTGKVTTVRAAGYHYQSREGSLTESAESGRKSQVRQIQRDRLEQLYRAAWDVHVAGGDPGDVIRNDISQQAAEQVATQTRRLQAVL